MKKTSPLSAVLLALACHAADAVVIPVSEDTYAAPSGNIGKTFGKEKLMVINGEGAAALLRFDVADYAGLIQPANVSSARVVFHLSEVKKAGDLTIRAVTSEWTEGAQGRRPAPTLSGTALHTIPAAAVIEDQVAVVDVTGQVKQWLATPASDFGLAVTCGTATNVQIATKEGVTVGHPAWLEIESHPQQVTGNEQIAAGVDAAKLGNGAVNNTELSYLDGVQSPVQPQLNTLTTSLNALAASVATSLNTLSTSLAGKVNKSGDTMTGNLDVQANIRLGNASQFFAASGEENLRIVRGTLAWNGTTMALQEGQGFTVTKTRPGHYRITFTPPFAATPTVTASYGFREKTDGGTELSALGVDQTSTAGTTLIGNVDRDGCTIQFIVAGPR